MWCGSPDATCVGKRVERRPARHRRARSRHGHPGSDTDTAPRVPGRQSSVIAITLRADTPCTYISDPLALLGGAYSSRSCTSARRFGLRVLSTLGRIRPVALRYARCDRLTVGLHRQESWVPSKKKQAATGAAWLGVALLYQLRQSTGTYLWSMAVAHCHVSCPLPASVGVRVMSPAAPGTVEVIVTTPVAGVIVIALT